MQPLAAIQALRYKGCLGARQNRQMRKDFWTIAASWLLLSCSRQEVSSAPETVAPVKPAAAEQSGELKLQQIQALGGLTLQLQQVEDSRCPMNAMCVRQGSAIATFLVQDAKGQSVTRRLYLGEALPAPDDRGTRSADTVHVLLGEKKYALILREVQPYPNSSDVTPPAKTVKVTVRPL